jgi:hypothetical protein
MTDQDAAPLTTADYQQLHGMLLSGDASVRAQGLGLAQKLTPDERQTFFDVQQTANAGKGERTRVDDQSPAILGAVSAGAGIARAVAAPAASVAARVSAGASSAFANVAAPQAKYWLTKQALTHLGVPPLLAEGAAVLVSGYKSGAKGAPAAAAEVAAPEAEAAASGAANATSTGAPPAPAIQGPSWQHFQGQGAAAPPEPPVTPAPAAAPRPMPTTPAAEPMAAARPMPGAAMSPQQTLNEQALAARRSAYQASQAPAAAAPPVAANAAKLSADEVRMGEALVRQGDTPATAFEKILKLRDAMAGSSAFSGLPSSTDARATMALLKATKYKS